MDMQYLCIQCMHFLRKPCIFLHAFLLLGDLFVCTDSAATEAANWVQDAYIPKDPATAKQAHRGFGFVTFANADDVDKVLSCAHTISNHEIAVQCAIPKVSLLHKTVPPLTCGLQASAYEVLSSTQAVRSKF